MKKETGKNRKQQPSFSANTAKPVCGTLLYQAECRGVTQKADSVSWAAPPGSIKKIVRK
jgi:hypothetical protein